jgi:hypothetical protein
MCPNRPTTRDLAFALMGKLSRGNPGAAIVVYKIFLNEPDGYQVLLDVDGLGWEGAHIWEAYKDVCREDLDALVRLVKTFG